MPKTVLVVDDNADERLIYGSMLEHFGYRVIVADDAEAGILLASAELPDLILMDVMLPTMNGLTATEVLRSMRRTQGIPVIAMSHYDVRPDSPTVAGCDHFEPKPIPPDRLRKLVTARIGPPEDDQPGDGEPVLTVEV